MDASHAVIAGTTAAGDQSGADRQARRRSSAQRRRGTAGIGNLRAMPDGEGAPPGRQRLELSTTTGGYFHYCCQAEEEYVNKPGLRNRAVTILGFMFLIVAAIGSAAQN